jgi:hypothetical protein
VIVDDLVRWYGQQLDTDEQTARAATQGEWVWSREFVTPPGYHHRTVGPLEPGDSAFIAAHDPARVLREIDSKRQLLARYVKAAQAVEELTATRERLSNQGQDPFLTDLDLTSAIHARDTLHRVVFILATVYADREGYEEGWAP